MEVVFIYIIYFLVGLFASTVGSLAGIGGGVIIKPALDFLGDYSVESIGVLSAFTVFSMASVSLISATREGFKIKGKTSFILAAGSLVGGVMGKSLFNELVTSIQNEQWITILQAGLLAVIMALILILERVGKRVHFLRIENIVLIGIAGLLLGVIAAFLGIGGGPLNVLILILFFSMGAKEAAINSIFIIFFSQIASLTLTGITTGFAPFNLEMLWFMIPGGMLGGLIGRYISQLIKEKHVEKIFDLSVIAIFLLNVYNMVKYFI